MFRRINVLSTHPVIPAQAGIYLTTGARLARGITAEPIPTASTQCKVDARLRGRDRGWVCAGAQGMDLSGRAGDGFEKASPHPH